MAREMVEAQFAPLFANLNRDARRGRDYIVGSSEQAARRARPMARQTRRSYNEALGEQAAIADALLNRVEAGGGEARLADAVAQVGGPAAAGRHITQAANLTDASAGGLLGLGQGMMGATSAAGAAEEQFARKQPGFFRAMGQQSLGDFMSQIQGQRGELQAQIPAAIMDEYGRIRGEQMGLWQTRDDRRYARRQEAREAASAEQSDAFELIQQVEDEAYQRAQDIAYVTGEDAGGRNTRTSRPYQDVFRSVESFVKSRLRGLLPMNEIQAIVMRAMHQTNIWRGNTKEIDAFGRPLGAPPAGPSLGGLGGLPQG